MLVVETSLGRELSISDRLSVVVPFHLDGGNIFEGKPFRRWSAGKGKVADLYPDRGLQRSRVQGNPGWSSPFALEANDPGGNQKAARAA